MMNLMQKGFTTFSFHERGFAPILILVGILVIVGVAGGAYFFGQSQVAKSQLPNPVIAPQTPQSTNVLQPTSAPDETANWKTYSNSDTDRGDQLGFAIKYPNYYQVMLGSDIVTRENIQIGIPYWFMKITRQEGTNDFVLIRTMQSVFSISQDISKGIIFNDKVINGYTFKQYRAENFFEGIGNCDAYGYVIEHNNIDYYNLYTCDKDIAIFDQMVSTFKFTN